MLFFLFGLFFVHLIYLFQCNLFQLVFYSVDLQCYLCRDANVLSIDRSNSLRDWSAKIIAARGVKFCDYKSGVWVCHEFECSYEIFDGTATMELPHYLFVLARTSLNNLELLSMEPPQSPKFNVPLWQPWIASPRKGTEVNFKIKSLNMYNLSFNIACRSFEWLCYVLVYVFIKTSGRLVIEIRP